MLRLRVYALESIAAAPAPPTTKPSLKRVDWWAETLWSAHANYCARYGRHPEDKELWRDMISTGGPAGELEYDNRRSSLVDSVTGNALDLDAFRKRFRRYFQSADKRR